jgi:RNA polymerase sigma-70 factor (sigma-E family)
VRNEEAFSAFVQLNGATLLHAARLLTGDHHRGEDLVQTVLAKLYLRWDKVDEPLAYARRALVTSNIDSGRRRWWGERPVETLPDRPRDDGALSASDERAELRRLLSQLPARERAVVVLRYYCDLSEQDTAATLGIALGTVKSSTSRALARLRVRAADGELT